MSGYYIKSSRDNVYVAIDGERDYQDQKWNRAIAGNRGTGLRTVDEWAMYLESYARKLCDLATMTGDTERLDEKLGMVRKIAAMAVACMEQHGAVRREEEAGGPAIEIKSPANGPTQIGPIVRALLRLRTEPRRIM